MMVAQTTGAVVIGGCYQGLGIVRSLGRRGIPVYVLDDQPAIAGYSRYATHSLRVADLRDEQQIVETLCTIGRQYKLENWVLYPTREELVVALARHRTTLTPLFRVPTPPWQTIRYAWDKRETYQLARTLGIPTPHIWLTNNYAEVSTLANYLPLVLKPAIKEHFFYATRTKAWRANTPAELAAHYLSACQLMDHQEIILQELIPGDGDQQFAFCSFFKDGEALASMVVQRRRQHPYEFGRASTYVISLDLPRLAEMSCRFLKAIDYYGLVEMEYKYDQRDATYKLLDVNARTWGYHSLGARAGVDFSALLFADQLGEPPTRCQATPGLHWIRLLTDLPLALQELVHGRLDLAWYLSTLRQIDVEAVFDRTDIRPALAEILLAPYLYFKHGF